MATNLLEVLNELRIQYKLSGQHHHTRPGWAQVDCPYCSKGSGRFRMGISMRAGSVHCWSCGRHHLWQTLAELGDTTVQQVKQLMDGVIFDRVVEAKKRGKLVLPEGVGPLLASHRIYLRSRGFNPKKLVKLWNIGGIGAFHKIQWSIFIPITLNDEIVSWTTRSISNNGRRYHAAGAEEEAISSKELLYGEDYARHSIVICEGPIDVWRIGPGAVATCGTSFTEEQILRMSKYLKRVVCFDNEPAAQQRAEELCDQLSVFDGETINVVLDSKDAAEASVEEIGKLRKKFLE